MNGIPLCTGLIICAPGTRITQRNLDIFLRQLTDGLKIESMVPLHRLHSTELTDKEGNDKIITGFQEFRTLFYSRSVAAQKR